MSRLEVNVYKEKISPFLLVAITLLGVIFIGSILLFLDYGFLHNWSNLSFQDYIDSLLISVSATCVTGLTSHSEGIVNAYSMFGHIVIMLLIQVGGLGFLTILAFVLFIFAGKLKFKDRHYISQIVGSSSVAHVGKFVKKIILISFICELIGFGLSIPAFINLYPDNIGEAIFKALFHSISAFNNAGFDIIGSQNLIVNSSNPVLQNAPEWAVIYLQFVTMFLIILGGIGYLVIAEIFTFKKPKQWSPFTKIVLSTTAVLLVAGSLLFIVTECFKANNPMTPLQAIFQSVTCRTAGFATYDQSQLSTAGIIVSCILMFIGGSPLSTAGGIKTTTIFLVILAIFSYLKGKKAVAFKRYFSPKQVVKAMSLMFLSLLGILVCYSFIYIIEIIEHGGNPDDLERSLELFLEVFSAFGTTGLSANLTPNLQWGSKLIICLLMFVGRIGPITLFSIFSKNIDKDDNLHFNYVQSDILIG